jgi:3-phosphoshikimate 1-carboxyvinyltransferase
MAEGESKLLNVLFSGDSRSCLKCMEDLGYQLKVDEEKREVVLVGGAPRDNCRINVGSAGTTARFLTALLAVHEGIYFIDASEQMKSRPMKPLLDTLTELGAKVEYVEEVGCLPIKLIGNSSDGGDIRLKVESSSQFLSALLISGCYYQKGLCIEIEGKEVAQAYVEI